MDCLEEESFENKDLDRMLEFETQIFLDIVHQDGLVVAAKGLSMDTVLINLLKVYSDPGNLVLVLNCSDNEEKHYVEKLKGEHTHRITFETSIKDREEIYLLGGIQFITTRILVVDLLKNRVPVEHITGIIVVRGHTVLESCQEAFALRLYRQKNKTGFVKAFSNSPQSFTVGYGHIERVMRALFVKEVYIWPRFHSTVVQSLRAREPQVIELQIPISDTMAKIQTCILDLMNLTVKELKRVNKTVELQEITVENCLTKQFHKILQSQLDCIWNQLSTKSKQLVADLKTLRHLIITLLYADPVTFYNLVCSYRTMEYAQTCTWILFEPAELMFTYASTLVFSGDKELNPEFCPKWHALSEILKVEIPADMQKEKSNENGTVLILCQDNKTCYQLNHFLTLGPRHYLFTMALKRGVTFKSINNNFKQLKELPEFKNTPKQTQSGREVGNFKFPKKAKVVKESKNEEEAKSSETEEEVDDFKDSYCLTMSQTVCDESDSKTDSDCMFEPFTEFENMNLTQLCEAAKANVNPTILIQTFRKADSTLELQNVLEEIRLSYVIMYHSNITAIRNIEIYEARRNSTVPLKVYFLIHNGTVEEQSYLTSLRREKEAFEYLISTKSTMVIPEDQDGKTDMCLALQREAVTAEINTRQGGASTAPAKQLVIVDMREFRSELPALIHKRGIEIEPLTITVGDYILTPDICVERKSISDLIGSLNSGRLYQQCTQMSRYYKKPMLLIEFDQNKTFSWQQNQFMISTDSDNSEIQKKLLLLTLHFPKLKLVWSASPYASAQLFEELKVDKDQPNVEYATALGNEQDLDLIETKYNVGVYDFVYKLPGITSKNIDQFMRRCTNMDQVIKMTENELQQVLGNAKDARSLYSILHEEHVTKKPSEQGVGKGKAREKFKFTKK
uniref:DNA repair endonuclease XPF n=2 Tax=Photinus pyralis TaxID=7054 RepID=A0A1Y1JT47_PHOPY